MRIKDEAYGPNSLPESSSETFKSQSGRRDRSGCKLTKPKANVATSTASQRSLKRSPTTPPPQAIVTDTNRGPANGDRMASESTLDRDEETDSGKEKTTVNVKEIWASVPRPTLKARYKLHNPLGPRWYKNHHLISPARLKPSMRPPTFFSPSFPPIGTASSPDYHDEGDALSTSPSHSPIPTPDSSQTRVQDGTKPRSRKTSQTTPDAIDLMDLTDPWGQNWHHQSPYEFGQTTTVATLDTYDLPKRTRHASFTATRQRTVAPSPLSQSTSAINLNPSQPEIKLPRKLSKRRTTNVATIFQDQPPPVDRKTTSAPSTPVETLRLGPDAIPSSSDILPKRMSVAPAGPYMSTPLPTAKRERRGSMLNRLVRKFSILKRNSDSSPTGVDRWSQNETNTSRAEPQSSLSGPEFGRMPSEKTPEGVSSTPGVNAPVEEKSTYVPPPKDDDALSLSSLEIPYSAMGKLTIANPDPEGNESQDVSQEVVPPDLPELGVEPESAMSPPLSSDPLPVSGVEKTQVVDKPLPPRIATPRFSRLILSDIISTPPKYEQSLPPLPPKDTNEEAPASPAREVTPPPPIPKSPTETPATLPDPDIDPIFLVDTSMSLDHVVHDVPISLSPARKVQTSPERVRSPIQKASPFEETPDLIAERGCTQSPPAQMAAKRNSPIRSSPPPQPSTKIAPVSSDTTAVNKPQTRSSSSVAQGRPAYSSKEGLDLSKSSVDTRLRKNSHSEPRGPPASAQVSFPSTTLTPGPSNNRDQWQIFADSPLSAASVLANPPTPYDHRLSINGSDRSSVPPTLPPKSVRQASPPLPSKTTGPATRQTETFRLVRSSSGNVYASSQTIIAQGQQWEIVESVDFRKPDKTSVKSREKDGRYRDHDHDRERKKDHEREREEREKERQRAKERERELEREREKAKERARLERELERAREKERIELEMAKEKELARERERERQRAKELRREKEKERERIREKERLREKERERERREREREREKEKEREKRKDGERREREKERERERRKDKERERQERDKRREREAERVKDRERDRDYQERRSRHYDRKSREYDWTDSSGHKSKDDGRHRESDYKSTDREHRPRDVDQHSRRERDREKHDQRAHRHHDDSQFYEGRARHDRAGHRQEEHHDQTSAPKRAPELSSSSHNNHQPLDSSAERPVAVRLERNPSTATRPTSQLPSADEMNAIRAREKWEMERLWKARSLHGLEPNAAPLNFIPSRDSTGTFSDDIPEIDPTPPPQIYGSSHTAFVVQPPFHHHSQIYHSMPAVPPPIIYSSPRPLSIPSIPDSISSYESYEHFRSYPGPPIAAPSTLPPSNPLPEPPRESAYKPAPLTSISPSKRRSTEYWTYNGITMAH